MASNPYITLTSGSASYKFRVILSGYKQSYQKSSRKSPTLSNRLDVSHGSSFETLSMVIMVRETETEEGYGTLETLRGLFRRTTHSDNLMTLTKNDGTSITCVPMGESGFQPLSYIVEGNTAWMQVSVNFIVRGLLVLR